MRIRRHRIPANKTAQARSLRTEAPFPERLLWSRLRAGRLSGFRFRRQHVVGPFIVEFYCASAKLVIELDGRSHEDRGRYDTRRTRYLESQGMRVVRFGNDEVIRNMDDVLWRIASEVGIDP